MKIPTHAPPDAVSCTPHRLPVSISRRPRPRPAGCRIGSDIDPAAAVRTIGSASARSPSSAANASGPGTTAETSPPPAPDDADLWHSTCERTIRREFFGKWRPKPEQGRRRGHPDLRRARLIAARGDQPEEHRPGLLVTEPPEHVAGEDRDLPLLHRREQCRADRLDARPRRPDAPTPRPPAVRSAAPASHSPAACPFRAST